MKYWNEKKKYIIGIVVVVIFIVSVVGIYIQKYSRENVITYTQFIEWVGEGKVREVELSNNPTLKFKLKSEDNIYVTDNPRIENLKESLLLDHIKVVESNQSTAYTFQYLISTALLIGIFVVVFKNVKKTSGSSMSLKIKPVEADELTTSFKSIAGNEEAKDQVQDVIDFIKSPEKYARLGARMPKGLIFYGPPGTGKTLMAKAVAKEAGVAFFSVSGSDFVQLYVGVGASRVREIFKEARKHGKAVIFIDEIDAIGKKRSANAVNSNDEKDQTLNALLTEMSGFKSDEGIVVIAATNRLDTLDEALLRPGRFDRHIEIGYPDFSAREQIIKLYLKNKPISEEVSISDLARQTVYFTGAMLENLVNEAAITAANAEHHIITNAHIESAFYTVIAGKEKKDRSNVSELDRRITAFHEAGHALVTKIVAPENSVTKVTIIPSTKGAGGFSMNIPKERMYMTKDELLNRIKISLAGRAAEELIFGKEQITTGASNDIAKASQDIKDYIMKYGMDEDFGLINLQTIVGKEHIDHQSIIDKCRAEIQLLYIETKNIIIAHRNTLDAIAKALLEKETLNEQEIASFFY